MKNFSKILAVLALSMFASLAIAGEMLPYDQAKFDQLATEGKPVVVAVKADWCSTCKAQKPLVKKYKVAMQSTLIAFKGGKEVDRSVGDTNQAGITALFNKTLN